MSCSMEMALWFEKCYEEKEKEIEKEIVLKMEKKQSYL